MPPFQNCQVSALLTVSAVTVMWKRLGATKAQPQSGRPHKLTEWDSQVLKHLMGKNRLSSVATLTTEFQIAYESNVRTRTVRRELHEMGFQGRAATSKPQITCAMTSIGWSGVKLKTIGLWNSVFWNEESCFHIYQSDR
jgi:hypothetical protein